MKNKLKEFIPLSERQRKKIWKNGFFVLDANVLLNMCRYSKKSCDELIEIIKYHKDNLWLPYQVGMEFFNNRLSVIEGVKSGFDKLLASISKTEEILQEGLKLNDFKSDTAHNIDKLREDIKRFRKNEENKIKKWQKEYEESDKEAILDEILSLYDGKVGDDYDEDKLAEIYKEGEKRYNEGIPPGYEDGKSKEKKGNRRVYGDLIWWKQAIDFAKEHNHDLVIVTDDKKDDWWYKVSGKTIGPRVELIREFNKETKGRSFLMYQTHQFMEVAKELDGANVSDSSIKEVKETGSVDYNQLVDKYNTVVTNFGVDRFTKYPWEGGVGIVNNATLASSALASDPNGRVTVGIGARDDNLGAYTIFAPNHRKSLICDGIYSTPIEYLTKNPDEIGLTTIVPDEASKNWDYLVKKSNKNQ